MIENHTKTFTEWWTNKIKKDKIENDPIIRDLCNEAWDESIRVNNEVYVVISKEEVVYTSAINGLYRQHKSANDIIKKNGKQEEWIILLERIENNENNNQ